MGKDAFDPVRTGLWTRPEKRTSTSIGCMVAYVLQVAGAGALVENY